MLQRAVNFCMGAVTVEVESAFPERILNLCGAHGIPFWDLTWRSPVCFTVTMTRKSWRRLRQQAERLDAKLTVEGREGLPYLALRLRRRTVLLAGLAACILLFFYSTFFIWDFAIEGNVTVSDEEILRSLRKNGVTLGTFAYSFRSDDLRFRGERREIQVHRRILQSLLPGQQLLYGEGHLAAGGDGGPVHGQCMGGPAGIRPATLF